MIQAARTGKQNIAEGSKAAKTSAEMELNPTNVARDSLEELRIDFKDYGAVTVAKELLDESVGDVVDSHRFAIREQIPIVSFPGEEPVRFSS